MSIQAKTLDLIPQNFLPSSIKFEDEFYTDIDSVRSSGIPKYVEIKNAIKREKKVKILFAGHTGSGKSTELNRLVSEIHKQYAVVKFSVKETNDPFTLQYEDLLVSSINKVLEFLNDYKDFPFKELDSKILEEFNNWFFSTEKIKEIVSSTDISTEAGLQGKLPFLSILNIYTKLSLKLKLSGKEKVIYKQDLQKNFTQLLNISKKLLSNIEELLQKEIILIIEDLDKIDTQKAKEIFIENNVIISEIPLTTIYTVPIFLMHSTEMSSLNGNVYRNILLPMIKTRTKNSYKEEYPEGINKIKELVSKRMDISLFEKEDDLNLLIIKTGGVFRDLFQVIVNASESAIYNNRKQINFNDDIRYYLNIVKSSYYRALSGSSQRNISPEDIITKLKELHEKNIIKPMAIDQIILEALRLQVLIEYNGDGWYGLHPLVIEHLEDLE
ncbi:hypothetical protein ACN9KI_08935 [Aliarcobacter butzleri]|uniref:hypothetical protein n=1 Tax=Aliarcobacter butzleri TaxID=28197 RepID=UPI003B21A7A7